MIDAEATAQQDIEHAMRAFQQSLRVVTSLTDNQRTAITRAAAALVVECTRINAAAYVAAIRRVLDR